MVLLAAERGLSAAEIAEIVRASEETVRCWLKRYLAEGVEGLSDAPQPGAPRKVTHCELFPTVKALIAAAYAFFERYNRRPREVLSIIGLDPAEIT